MNLATIFHCVFIVLLSSAALSLTLSGGHLVYLGGSLYYVIAGISTAIVAVLIKRWNASAPKV